MTFTKDKLYIGGQWVDPEGGTTTPVINPATEESIGSAPVGSVNDARRAIAAARNAFDDGPWPTMSIRKRADHIRRLGEAVERRRAELAATMVGEAGILASYADGAFVQLSADICYHTADEVLPALSFMEAVKPSFSASMTGIPQVTQGVILREPVGVASLITPFNGPLALSFLKLVPALAAGCTVVLKPSPYTPLEVLAIGDLVEEAGFPPGVVNVITGDLDVGAEITTNAAVDIISFTGSDAVGRQVMAQAAPGLKRVVLELGGKSANVVFADADLDRVALEVVGSMVFNCGQQCVALSRTVIESSAHDELAAKVATLLGHVVIGDPADPATTMGPVIRERERSRIEDMIDHSQKEGATIAFGGGRPQSLERGYFLNPTLLVDVDNTMSIARQEVFGPVGAIIPFTDEADAVRIANDTPYGLNGAVFTGDTDRAFRVAKQIRTGRVNINCSTGHNPDAPFGGRKQSGMGREGGRFGVEEFLETKFVSWQAGTA